MENWKRVWRQGFAPGLSTVGLQSLREALEADDGRLLQGATTSPPPMACVHDWPVEGTCAVGWSAWHGEGLETVGEIEEFFARACHEADEALGELGVCRHFLNWYDDSPREAMRRSLLDEVNRVLAQRFPIDDEVPFQPASAQAA